MYSKLIVVIGMPRSGTSWLGQIFDSNPAVRFRLSPIFSYEFKNCVNEQSSRGEWINLFEGAYKSTNNFMRQVDRRNLELYPSFSQKDQDPAFLVIKDTRFHNLLERMLELFDTLKVVSIVRHPCGAIHSWLTAPREFPVGADPTTEWRTGTCRKTGYGEFWGFEDWKAVTRMHMRLAQAFPGRLAVQRYEDLVRDRITETKKLFEFVGLVYTRQTEAFLEASGRKHEADEYAVFKHPTVADRWRKELNPAIRDAILREVAGTDLECFL